MKYQVCEIKNGNLRHFYYSEKKDIFWMSANKAYNLSLEEARSVLEHYRKTKPERDLFIQSEWDCHFRETDRDGYIVGGKLS